MTATELLARAKAALPPLETGRIVYTCVTGGYDEPTAPPADAVDYVAFTDASVRSVPAPWRRVAIEGSLGDPRRTAKAFKILPHLCLPERGRSLWIDANFRILRPLRFLFDRPAAFGALRHPKRSCVYEEVRECLAWRNDDAGLLERQAARYRAEGHPVGAGLFRGGLLLREHGAAAVRELMEDWWREIEAGSVRDQVSLPYVARKRGFGIEALTASAGEGPAFRIRAHPGLYTYAPDGAGGYHRRRARGWLIYRLAGWWRGFRARATTSGSLIEGE